MIKKIKENKIIIFIIALIISLLIEICIFNGISIYKIGNNYGKYEIKNENIKIEEKESIQIKEIKKNPNIFDAEETEELEKHYVEESVKEHVITINFEKKYVSKIQIDYSTNDISVGKETKFFEIDVFDEYGNPKKRYEYVPFEENFNKIVKNIDNNVETIKIGIQDDFEKINIKKITVINEFSFNIYRFAFIFILSITLLFALFYIEKFAKQIEIFFVVIAFGTGLLMIILTPNTTRCSWDDAIHFEKAYHLLDNTKYESNAFKYSTAFREMKVNVPNSIEENKMLNNYLNKNNAITGQNEGVRNYDSITYSDFSYLPSAIVLKICKVLKVPFAISFKLGKIINLLLYCIIGYFAIRKSIIGKKVLFVLLLLPTNIFLASQYSKDSYITALIALGITALISCYYQKGKISLKQLIIIILSFIIGSLSKAIYIPFLLLILFFPSSKFKTKKQATIVKIIIAIILIMILSTFVLPTVSSPSEVSDVRGGDTSTRRQLQLIFEQPISFVKVFIPEFMKIIIDNFISVNAIANYCILGNLTGNIYYLMLLVIIFVIITGEGSKNQLSTKVKILLGIIVFGIIGLIMVSMYLSYTPVASTSFQGVQARYFLPLLYPFLLIFNTNKIKSNFDTQKYNLILILLLMFILFYSIYIKFLVPFNI